MRLRLTVLVLLVLVAGSITAVLVQRDASRPESGVNDGSPATSVPVEVPPPEMELGEDLEAAEFEAPPPTEHTARSAVVAHALTGRVLDEGGHAIAGARLSWSPLPSRLILAPLAWHEVDWEEHEHASQWATSDASGSFSFEDSPEPDEVYGTVIWATHPEWEAVSLVLGPDHAGEPVEALHTARAAPRTVRAAPRTVRVIDGSSQPVAGATVWQFSASEAAGTDRELALRTFFRRTRTGEAGETHAFVIGGDEVLAAETATARSEPATGPASGDVTLTLLSTFSAHGRIVLADGAPLEPWPRVTWGAVRGRAFVPLGTSQHEEGAWGPVQIPLVRADAFRFELGGGGLVRAQREIDVPAPGQSVQVDFETVTGADLWFLIQNEAGETLTDASVEVFWENGLEWPRLESPPVRKDGYIYLRGSRPGAVYYEATAPGYARVRIGPKVIPQPEPSVWIATLARAGGITGRCRYQGEAVADFAIASWPEGTPHDRLRHDFADRPDGSFEIPDLEEGEHTLLAFAESLGQSEAVHATVVAGETQEVDFELSEPALASGQVLDAVTRQPLAGVEVRRAAFYDTSAVGMIGAPVLTDRDGEFELDGLARSGSGASFYLKGYSRQTRQAPPGDPLRLGIIELAPTQPLEFLLPETVDPTGFAIEPRLHGSRSPFDAGGRARIDPFEAGWYNFRVVYPDGSLFDFSRTLEPGEDWTIPVPIEAGRNRLVLDIAAGREGTVAEGLWARVQFLAPDGEKRSRFQSVAGAGPIAFDQLPPVDFHVAVIDAANRMHASASGTLAHQTELRMRIELEGRPHRFRILDTGGAPVASAHVDIDVEGLSFARIDGTTDATGTLVLHGLPDEGVSVSVSHPVKGVLADAPVEFDADGGVTLVLDAGARAAVQLTTGGQPLTERTCYLYSGRTRFPCGPATTDERGVARWTGLSAGDYVVEFEESGYWPVSEEISTERDDPAVIPVRRLGGVELVLRNTAGLRATGIALEIRSIDFACSISTWAEARRLELPPAGLVSDEEGLLRISGLPEGSYSWSGDEGRVGGDFAVQPGATVEVPLTW